jgi:hypothetical protein
MTGNPDTSLTIYTHHHILPDFFWQETEAMEKSHFHVPLNKHCHISGKKITRSFTRS